MPSPNNAITATNVLTTYRGDRPNLPSEMIP